MKNIVKILVQVFVLGFLITACTEKKSNEPDLSAIPHADALPSTALSDEDKAKLSNAQGKQTENINTTDLQNMFAASSEKLYIYAFWKNECDACIQNLINLKQLNNQIANGKIEVIAINLDKLSQKAAVNYKVRSENIAFETYQLSILDNNWYKQLDASWNGAVPAIFMINSAEEVFLKYFKELSKNELEAITQTLII